MTTVVNIKHFGGDISGITMIDRSTIFGNPFNISKTRIREQSIKQYRLWFYKKIQLEMFREAVESLRDKTLGCWCKPLDCHGDIIVEYLNNIGNVHLRQDTIIK